MRIITKQGIYFIDSGSCLGRVISEMRCFRPGLGIRIVRFVPDGVKTSVMYFMELENGCGRQLIRWTEVAFRQYCEMIREK